MSMNEENTEPKTVGCDGESPKEGKKKKASALLRLLQGMLVGVGGILPGISGGVMCAIFGLYQPMMEVMAHPVKNLKKHIKLLLPVVIGMLIGFLGLAKLVELLLHNHEEIAVSLFVGLILGMLPSLWREAGEKGRYKSSYISLVVTFVVFLTFFMVLKYSAALHIEPNGWWYFLSGALEGVGLIVPGMSASATLIFLGLLEPLMAVIGSFPDHLLAFLRGSESFTEAISQMQIIPALCVGAGAILIIVLFARLVNHMLGRYASQMYHAIFGIVVATTVPIIPYKFNGTADMLIQLACISGGFVAAWLLDKVSRKYVS